MSDFSAEDGETPMTVEERSGLVQTTITLHRELNTAEQVNIAAGCSGGANRCLFRVSSMKLS